MTTRIRTADAEAALRTLIQTEVLAASGGNTLLSRAEGRTLSAYVHRVELTLRAEGGPGTRVHVDRLIDRAIADALAVWDRFNPPEAARDHLWLARDELASIARADPDVGEITSRALALLSAPPPPAPGLSAAEIWAIFEALDLSESPDPPDATRVDARAGQPGREGLSAGLVAAFDFYYRAEARDIGSARLYRLDRAAAPTWALLSTNDGDEGFLELLDDSGTILDGARFWGGRLACRDAPPGRGRLALFWTGLGGYAREEGLSEPDERAAAGQPPQGWTGEAHITDGSITPAGSVMGALDFGSAVLTTAQRELATAAFEHLWQVHLRFRAEGAEPLLLGLRRQGTLAVGAFNRSTDGQTYETASWRDIDDGSFVLYFSRDAAGLTLVTEQFDN